MKENSSENVGTFEFNDVMYFTNASMFPTPICFQLLLCAFSRGFSLAFQGYPGSNTKVELSLKSELLACHSHYFGHDQKETYWTNKNVLSTPKNNFYKNSINCITVSMHSHHHLHSKLFSITEC